MIIGIVGYGFVGQATEVLTYQITQPISSSTYKQ